MSILIKGMNMPNDCCQCKLARYDDYENETFCPFTDVMCLSIGRQDNCPLEEVPETHKERTETHACDCISRKEAIDAHYEYCNKHPDAGFPVWSLKILEDLPSVQPEPSMEECACCVLSKPEPHWIPVTERLPEAGSWAIWCSNKGIIQVARWKMDAIDHFFPDQGFFQLDDAVAWMPLPEPYREDGSCHEPST